MTALGDGPRYPDVTVQLTSADGNAYAVIGAVAHALRRAHGTIAERDFKRAAFAAESYDALLVLCEDTVEVE